MNKESFIEELSRRINYSIEKCDIINSVLEDNFFISKSNKDKIIKELMGRLNITYEEGLSIYEESIKLIKSEIKDKIRHPFGE